MNAINYLAQYKILLIYLGMINILTFIFFAVDKLAAMKKRTRIRVRTLLGLCFVGGALGGLCGIYLCHHKTRKKNFTVGVPLMLLMQIVVLFYMMNR